MYCNGIVAFAEIFVSPDLMEQLFGTDHPAFLLAKNREDGKFSGSQVQRLFIQRTFMGPDIQGPVSYTHLLFSRISNRGCPFSFSGKGLL